MRSKHFLVVCTAVAILASGCTFNNKHVASGSSGPAGATPSATASTMSEEDQAVADADATYRKWNQTFDSCMADPQNAGPSCFDGVSIGTQLVADKNSLAMSQADGTHGVGEARIVSLNVVSVDLTDRVDRPEDPTTGLPEVRTVPTVVFDVCTDLTGSDLVDAAGNSQVPPDFPKYRRTLAVVANYSYPDPTQWRVSKADKGAETPTCEP